MKDEIKSKESRSKGKSKKSSRGKFNPKFQKQDRTNASFPSNKNDATCSLNDVQWYSRYPELLAAAARIPMPYTPGMLVIEGIDSQYNKAPKIEIPGVMGIWYSPSIGRSLDSQSPATIMSKELWARIRSKFSADLDADAPDIMMYALELDQIHAYLAWLKRLYRTLAIWSPENRDFPNVVLYSMGLDDVDIKLLQTNQMRFFGRLNTTIRQANKFLVPDDMDIYHRHRWMNENIYGDEDSPKSQMYLFNPKVYWLIDTTSATKLVATYVPNFVLGSASTTYDTLEDLIFKPVDDMIAAMSDWGDAYTINGYIERAFEGAQFYGTALMEYGERLTPIYSPEVLSQIENIHVSDNGTITTWDVTQDPATNTIIHEPWGTIAGSTPPMLNLHMDVPTAADITIATRLTCWADNADHGKLTCGTEVVNNIVVHTYRNTLGVVDASEMTIGSSKKLVHGKIINYDTAWTTGTFSGIQSCLRNLSYLSSWRHHPVMLIWYRDTTSTTSYDVLPFVDMHNFNFVQVRTLEELHRVCIYSEFNCFRQQ